MTGAMHALGMVSLVAMAALSAWIISDAIFANRHRILAALRGEPVPPAASVATLPSDGITQLRDAEAVAEPALQVRA